MSTPTSIKRHPTHPMLIVFPIGLWVFSLICYIVYLAGGSGAWETASIYTMAGGIIGALLAAVPGFIDMLAMPSSRAKTVARIHGGLNTLALIMLAVAFLLRLREMSWTVPFALTVLGIVLLGLAGWLGGHLVYVLGVGVEFEGKEKRAERKAQEHAADE